MKTCNVCFLEKGLTQFYFRPDRNTYSGKCESCRKIQRLVRKGDEIKYCKVCEEPLSIKHLSDYCNTSCGSKEKTLPWNQENALFLGWITSDGCMHDSYGLISFTNTNKQLINSFNKIGNVNTKNHIAIDKANNRISYRVKYVN